MACLLLNGRVVRITETQRLRSIFSLLLLLVASGSSAQEKLTERIEAYRRWKAHWSGPNCHQTTLFAHGYSPSFRYVDPSEFEIQMQIHGCAPIADQTRSRVGDLGLFVDVEDGIVHSFTRLEEDRVFSKTGTYSSFPAEVQRFSEMSHWFWMNEKCFTPGMAFSKDCPRVLRYWRCPTVTTPPDSKLPDALATLSRKLDELETWCSDWVRSPDLPQDADIDSKLQTVARIRTGLQAHAEEGTVELPLRLLKARAFSLERQILMFADPD